MSNSTREKILATTSQLLEKQGYHATGLNQIVKESKTPRGSIYYYFPDGKEELASEAITQRMKGMATYARAILSQIDDPVEAFYKMLLDMSQTMEKHSCSSGAPIAAVALEASNTSERIRTACANGYKLLQDVFMAKLVIGGFSAEKASSLATTINATIEGAMILSRTQQNASILENAAHNIKVLLQNTLKE